MADQATLPARLVLYDGVCGLCDKTVQFLLDHDEAGTLRFATLQGETGQGVLARHPELAGVDSVMFVENHGGEEKVWVRSKAVFRMARYLDAKTRWLGGFSFLPQGLADFGYDTVASIRYRIFGKLDVCRVPDPAVRARFLP